MFHCCDLESVTQGRRQVVVIKLFDIKENTQFLCRDTGSWLVRWQKTGGEAVFLLKIYLSFFMPQISNLKQIPLV
jgi:hypothetical protein